MGEHLSKDDEVRLFFDFVSGIESVPFLAAFYDTSEEHVEAIIEAYMNKAVSVQATQTRANGEFSELTEVDEDAIREQYLADIGVTISDLAEQFGVGEDVILQILLRMHAIENESYVYADREKKLPRSKIFELVNLYITNPKITTQDLLDRYGISMYYLGRILIMYGDVRRQRVYRKPSPESIAVDRTPLKLPNKIPRRKVPKFTMNQWARDPSKIHPADAHIINQTYKDGYIGSLFWCNYKEHHPPRARRVQALQEIYPTLSEEDIREISKKEEEINNLKRNSRLVERVRHVPSLTDNERQLMLISYILGAETLLEMSHRMVLPIRAVARTLVGAFASLLEADAKILAEYKAALKLGAELEYSSRLAQYKSGPIPKHSADVRADIVRRVKEDPNASLAVLARQFSVIPATIASIAEAAGIKRREKRLTPDDVNEALMRFIVQGESSLELSFTFDVRATSIRERMKLAFYFDIEESIQECIKLGYPMSA